VVSSLAASGGGKLVAKLTDTAGQPIAAQTVTMADSSGLSFFPNGASAVTDSSGFATVVVNRATLFEFGQGTFTVDFAGAGNGLFASAGATSCTLTSTSVCIYPSNFSTGFRAAPPPLKLELTDASGVVTNTIGSSGLTSLKATLKFPDGTPVVQKRIDITGDLTKVSFPEGSSQLTDANGVATIKVSRSSATVGGAGTLSAATTISGTSTSGTVVSTVVTGAVDYSVGAVVGAATLVLDTLDVGATTLSAYGTRQISARAMLGTSVAPSVQVSFSSNCGQISPATAPTNANGIAVASFTATDVAGAAVSTLGCGGKTVDISVSAVGASVLSKSFSVLEAPATNLGFVVPADATKSRIYLANSGGSTQTPVEFLLSNARGEPIPGKDVLVSLKTLNGGIPKATFVTVDNTAAKTLTTDSFGKIAVPVFSGTIPTNVLVNAALVSNSSIQTDSSVVVIASGRPAQARVSLVRGKAAIRGFNYDGSTTTVTMSLADRQGNPVPDGTAVNFVTEGGVMIPPTCVTGSVPGNSQCTVNIRSQNPRPSNGFVSILAYSPGEEDFVDANFNNVYDCGETYTDLVTAYRDDKDVGLLPITPTWGVPNAFVPGEFSVPRSASVSSCATGTTPSPTAGDGVWGAADVRGQVVIVFSTDESVVVGPPLATAAVPAVFYALGDNTAPTIKWIGGTDPQWSGQTVATGLMVSIQDMNGRSVPTGSPITVAVTDNSPKLPTDGVTPTPLLGTCALVSQSHTAVPDSLDPLIFSVTLKQCVTGDQVAITVTTPAGVKTFPFSVP
jgi:hypothetical protein